MTKLADKPAYCCSCFQQEPVRYVDFDAVYDGPMIPGAPSVSVDDLIICERCLEEAFDILDPQNLKETIRELEQIVTAQQEEIRDKDKAILGARATISELVDHPVAKIPGKPRLEGVSDEVREQITKARYARRGTSSDPHQHKRKAEV